MAERGDWKAAILLAARAGILTGDAAAELIDIVTTPATAEPTSSQVARWMGISEASLLALVTLARTLPPDAPDEQVREAFRVRLAEMDAAAQVHDGTPATLVADTLPLSNDGLWQTKTLPLTDGESTPTIATSVQPQVLARPPRIPPRLGPYILGDELGHGGMGIVFRARHEKLGTPCAIKVLVAGEHASVQAIARFQREAAAVAKMGKHPNIVSVYDLGQEGSLAYYAMELVEGTTLRAMLRERRPTFAESATIAEKVSRAMHFAHQHGVIHRDIKPDNILIRSGPEGSLEPQIMDFGLARDVSSNAALSATGQLLGTPNYMAPEQIDGLPEAVDARTDVYAIGSVLYEMITGQQAHPGDVAVRVFASILTGEVVPPRTIAPEVPRDLETICMKAMALEPDRRYASAEALADDLARFRRGEPVLARPVGLAERLWRRAKRNRAVALLAVGLGLAVLLALGEVAYFAVLPRLEARARVRENARVVRERRDKAAALLEKARSAETEGRAGEARSAAEELVSTYATFAAKGEDLPVSEAHEVLGRLARARKAPRDALVAFFRAYETAIGTPRAAETLVRIGEQLYEMDEIDRARGVFERALGERPNARAELRARLGLALCRASDMRFEEARSELAALRSHPEAEPADAARIDRFLRFLSVLTPRTRTKPGSFDLFQPCDIEGDGVAEIVSVSDDAREVVLSRFDGKGFAEAARVKVLGDEPFSISTLASGDLDGDGRREVFAAGGDANQGVGLVAVVAVREHGLDVVASSPLKASLAKGAIAAGDLDGDRKNELLVGTTLYERALHIYRFDGAARALKELGAIPMGGDVLTVLSRDRNGNGLADVWVVLGPWSGYEIASLEVHEGKFELRARRSFAGYGVVDPAASWNDGGEVLAAASWKEAQIVPLRELLGKKGAERKYAAPGLYLLQLGSDLVPQALPIWTTGRLEGLAGSWVFGFRGKGAEYAWGTAPPGADGRPSAASCIYERGKDGYRPCCLVRLPGDFATPQSWDLDGDGDTELLFGLPVVEGGASHVRRIDIMGLGTAAETTSDTVATQGPCAATLPRRTSSPTLVAAREAIRVGLVEEALGEFEHVVKNPPTAEDLEEAALGALDCRIRLGRIAEAAEAARATMSQYPSLRAPIGRALLDALERHGEWDSAGRTIEELLLVPGLTNEERARLAERSVHLGQLRRRTLAFEACGPAFLDCDLLATSPLWVRREDDGSLSVACPSEGREGLFVPFSSDRSGYRLQAEVDVHRLEWASGLGIGFLAGDPAASPMGDSRISTAESQFGRHPTVHSVRFSASGETNAPLRACDASWYSGGTSGGATLLSSVAVDGAPLKLAMEYAPHVRLLLCEAATGDQAPSRVRLENVPLEEARVFLAIGSLGGGAAATYWGTFRVRSLSIAAGGAGTRPMPFHASRAVDLIFLANGKWVQGKVEEARALYDRAVRVADLDARREEEMRALGMPSNDAPWVEPFLKWTAVDARFWRALLAAESGDEEAARSDLAEAHDLSAERFRALVTRSALGLLHCPRASDALRRHILARSEMDDTTNVEQFLGSLFQEWGPDATNALLAGRGWTIDRVAEVCGIEGEACGAETGDRVLSLDGREVADYASFRRIHGEALDAEKTSIALTLRRGEKEVGVTFDPRRTRIDVRDGYDVRNMR